MNLAPIVIITYSRINHLRKTIESLKTNSLARQSELFIFIDGPRLGDEEKVNIVKEYAYKIDGFKIVHIKERITNDRAGNYFEGADFVLKKYGRIIFLEDDNIVSKAFLEYMNNGLDFYEDDKNIMAVSGYNVPVNFPNDYKYDYYKSNYFNAWGFATWADRKTLEIEKYNGQYKEMLVDKKLYKKIKKIHPKLISGLKKIHEGTLNAGDYKIVFHLIKNNLYAIKPIESFVNNIGHDGSGVHCGVSDKFNNIELNTKQINFIKDIEYDKKIDDIYYSFFYPKKNFFEKLKRRLLRIMYK